MSAASASVSYQTLHIFAHLKRNQWQAERRVRPPGQYLFNLFIQKPYHYIWLIFGDCRARGERRLRCIVEECWIYYLAASKERIQNNVSRCISCWWVQYSPESCSSSIYQGELSGTLDQRCYSTVLSLSAYPILVFDTCELSLSTTLSSSCAQLYLSVINRIIPLFVRDLLFQVAVPMQAFMEPR